MQLKRPFFTASVFLIYFTYCVVAHDCKYEFSTPIQRLTTSEGYFSSFQANHYLNWRCKNIDGTKISTINISDPLGDFYLEIVESNIPDLNMEQFSSMSNVLTGISIINANITHIDSTSMNKLDLLKQIILNNNNLNSNQTDHFYECENLKTVSMSHNKLTTLKPFTKISNLEFLILDNNLINNIEGISKLKKLKQINLSQNNISVVPTEIQDIHPVELDLSFNNITIFEDCRNIFQTVKLHNNKLKTLCMFSNTTKEIFYSDNVISQIGEKTFHGLTKLKILDLSDNLIPEITFHVFDNLTQLKYLNLSHNSIQYLYSGCFVDLEMLTTLDLNNNNLHELESGIFTGLDDLQYLDLSGNYINGFDINLIIAMHGLNTLYLENAKIDEMTVEKFPEHFPYLTTTSLSFTSVGCDKLIGIIKDLKSNYIHVKKGSVRYRENIHGISCDASIKNATETIEEITLYKVLKSMSRIYAIIIVICIMIIAVVLSSIVKKGYDLAKKNKNLNNQNV